jgi:hypothetical protein
LRLTNARLLSRGFVPLDSGMQLRCTAIMALHRGKAGIAAAGVREHEAWGAICESQCASTYTEGWVAMAMRRRVDK